MVRRLGLRPQPSAEHTLLCETGVSIEQIRRGEHTTSPLFEALRIAERFGQDPTTFLERLRQMPAAELETLRWYAAIRMVQDMAAE